MHLLTYHLRSHISWSAARIQCLFLMLATCYTKVSQAEITLGIENEILWFDVSVKNRLTMHELERNHNAGDQKLSLFFREDKLTHVGS